MRTATKASATAGLPRTALQVKVGKGSRAKLLSEVLATGKAVVPFSNLRSEVITATQAVKVTEIITVTAA